MSRSKSTLRIAHFVESIMKNSPHKEKISSALVFKLWKDVMPNCVSSKTISVFIKNSKILVKVNSPALRLELSSFKNDIIKKLKDKQKELVNGSYMSFDEWDDIVFL